MNLITLDFETYYDKDYSLTKMTTESYIRDTQFETIGVGVKVNDGPTEWASGTEQQIKEYLQGFDWANSAALAHNAMFDAAIISWRYDISPKFWFDTLSMGRMLHGVNAGGSLKALAERYGIGVKGTEVENAKGKRLEDFTDAELARYGDYCINDVELTYDLFQKMSPKVPKFEMHLIDLTLRMYVEPVLDLDLELLENHLNSLGVQKQELLDNAGITDKKDLMSNPKFAELLEGLGVQPPMKVSAATGKTTYAFAKTDEGFKALQEHEDARVQALVEARLGNKSTLEETRTKRFIDIAHRGLLPAPVKYYAAHTGRWGGTDKINLQNLPSRGPNGKVLKRAIVAPEGYMIVEADSSQIEARVLAWLAEQDDLVGQFERKEDVYKHMAMQIYGLKDESEVTKDQRFIGKTTILGAGYGMGAVRFQEQLKSFGVYDVDLEEARRIIQVYRRANGEISRLWQDCNNMLENMTRGAKYNVGRFDVIDVLPNEFALRLPTGLTLRYDGLTVEQSDGKYEFFYKARRGQKNRIYGGKVVENLCQALARCIIGWQMLKISKKYKVAMTVHDSIVCCVKEDEVADAQAYVEMCMRSIPKWAEGLPIDCESGTAKSYGDCE
jgi:DNA polymerase